MVNRKGKKEAQTSRKELVYPIGPAHSYQLTGFLVTSSGRRQEQRRGEASGPPAGHSQHYKKFAKYDQQTKTLGSVSGIPGL